MGLNGISRSINGITTVSRSRARQTPRPSSSFKEVMRSGAQVLLSGARVATRIVGGPLLSAAVTGEGAKGVDAALGGSSSSGDAGLDQFKALQDQRMGDELQLLKLQQDVQDKNRAYTLASNMMKARHDTEKAAINNVRT